MELTKAEKLAITLMNKHGLTPTVWNFKFDNSKVRFGVCKQSLNSRTLKTVKGEISLSRFLVEANTEAEVKDTILHEIAHALTPRQGHNEVWKRKCIEIGARPEQYYTEQNVETVKHLARYRAVCSDCGHVHVKHRMTVAAMNKKIACKCQARYRSWDERTLLKFIDTKK